MQRDGGLTLISVLISVQFNGGTAFQLASESIVTSSVFDPLKVFKIAHIYWSISIPSVRAGLLVFQVEKNSGN